MVADATIKQAIRTMAITMMTKSFSPVALAIDAREAARLCGMSRATWYRLVSSGRAPSSIHKSRRVVRWPRAELVAWIEAGMPARDMWERMRGRAFRPEG